ncbi:MAG: glycosyltransferase [Myxococcales bacterium]|nr:glycosyltransferase [Myxococcota bacterium]MDW8283616.1 glycosyltransferase [Myxococcales bacterium]
MSASNAPATVLIIVDGLGLSGKTRAAVSLALGLDPARYRAVFCCFRREDSPLAAQLAQGGVPLHEVPCEDGLHLRTVVRLRRLMQQVRPDVVHCYNPRAMLYGGLAAQLCGLHATVGSLSAFACQVPDQPYGFLPQPLFTTSRRNRWRNQLVARLMRYLVAVSRTLGERFCRFNGVPLTRLRVIAYGASVEQMASLGADEIAAARAELGAGPGHVLVGSLGRLVEQKDYPTQLAAFAAARKDVPELRMVLLGDGPLRAELVQQATALGILDGVHLAGHREDVARCLRALDIFLLASKFEPFGVAVLEAMAAGLPIVATRVNEIPEIVPDGRCGLLVPRQDPLAMAAALVRLGRDEELRRRMGEQARREAKERFSLQAMVRAYQDLYDEARAGAPAGLPARLWGVVRQGLMF